MSVRNARAAALPARLSRSWLLVSANKPHLFEPAEASDADSVIFDLEAAVPDDEKEAARENVKAALAADTGMTAWVRVNGRDSEHWHPDLEALRGLPGLRGVVLALTEKPEQVTLTAMQLAAGVPVIALIESAIGIERATEIAKAPGTFRLAFGTNDFRKDVGVSDDPLALAYARGKLAVASRAGLLPGAIDGPPAASDSPDSVLESTKVTTSMGLTGRLCLNKDQVDAINDGLSPSDDERQWAREMLSDFESGADVTDGSYLPRVARAQKIAALADSYGLWKD